MTTQRRQSRRDLPQSNGVNGVPQSCDASRLVFCAALQLCYSAVSCIYSASMTRLRSKTEKRPHRQILPLLRLQKELTKLRLCIFKMSFHYVESNSW
jgi:hypothetical protein